MSYASGAASIHATADKGESAVASSRPFAEIEAIQPQSTKEDEPVVEVSQQTTPFSRRQSIGGSVMGASTDLQKSTKSVPIRLVVLRRNVIRRVRKSSLVLAGIEKERAVAAALSVLDDDKDQDISFKSYERINDRPREIEEPLPVLQAAPVVSETPPPASKPRKRGSILGMFMGKSKDKTEEAPAASPASSSQPAPLQVSKSESIGVTTGPVNISQSSQSVASEDWSAPKQKCDGESPEKRGLPMLKIARRSSISKVNESESSMPTTAPPPEPLGPPPPLPSTPPPPIPTAAAPIPIPAPVPPPVPVPLPVPPENVDTRARSPPPQTKPPPPVLTNPPAASPTPPPMPASVSSLVKQPPPIVSQSSPTPVPASIPAVKLPLVQVSELTKKAAAEGSPVEEPSNVARPPSIVQTQVQESTDGDDSSVGAADEEAQKKPESKEDLQKKMFSNIAIQAMNRRRSMSQPPIPDEEVLAAKASAPKPPPPPPPPKKEVAPPIVPSPPLQKATPPTLPVLVKLPSPVAAQLQPPQVPMQPEPTPTPVIQSTNDDNEDDHEEGEEELGDDDDDLPPPPSDDEDDD